METQFQVSSARLAASNGDRSLRRSSDVLSSLRKSSARFVSRVTKALDESRSSSKSPFVGAMKAKRPRKASGLKIANKPFEVPSSCNENIDFGLGQADAL